MSVSNITSSTNAAIAAAEKENNASKAQETKNNNNSTETKKPSGINSPASVYSKSSQAIDRNEIDRLLKESETSSDSIRKLLMNVMNKQGKKYDEAWGKMDFSLIDPEMREAARKDVAEDGYFGVKATSERILDFAKALSGGDPSRIASLRDAVEKGFKQAEEAWGDKLPQISQDTMDAVRTGFDEWEKSYNSETTKDATEPV